MTDRSAQLHSLSIDRDEPEARSGISLITMLSLLVGAIIATAALMWFFVTPPAPAPAAAPVTTAITTTTTPSPAAPAAPAPRTSGLVASGYVVARRQATISAEITGRIRDVLVEEGTRVEVGQVLARLDDTRALIQLDLLQSQLNAASARIRSLDAQLAEARLVATRAADLAARNIGPQANVSATQAQVDSLAAQLAAARSDRAAAAVMLVSQQDLIERHIVRAPFAGIVIAKNAQVGEILSPASAGGGFTRTGVATLVDMDSLEIEVDVNEGQIGRVTPGQRVEARLDAYPDWRIPAHVEAIIPTADRARATIQVRVAFDERDDRILPDMAARVIFVE
ncbi:efflux RND transporter periplasmic adaptor subunit [Maricaulis salignorans]|uniref:RND family efflux transporter, MFP subunit n=1 Tax=Maricaulis salignorans TaxID=144026 RepID=A0A1G9MLR2_9PROT|nr:efflux RND transporter periplasmic adaptor subunit [Maricaulis salignorans]SDL75013.1 RND family efflux transporter, MFP subunit [Maricaulis salignorans]